MKWILNLSTRTKLFAGFGLMFLFLAAGIGTAYRGITVMEMSHKESYETDFTNVTDAMLLRIQRNGMRAALLDMLLAAPGPERDKWRQDVEDRSKEIGRITQALTERNRSDPEFLAKLEDWNTVRSAYAETRDREIIPLIYEGKDQAAKKLILGVQVGRYEKMRDICEQLGARAEEHARTAVIQSEATANRTLRVFSIVSIIALLLAVVMAAFFSRIIANPLRELSRGAERVAVGDLRVAISSDERRDEVGALAQTFQRMVENLRAMNRELREGINVLASAASEIVASTTQLASGAAEAATAVSETTATVEEVKQTAQVASQKAKYVSETAQKSAQVSQTGRKSVEEAIEGMRRIREQMGAVAESIVKLSEQSQAIGEIIATVNDLAEQSNLLAVNAAIEAAKAGEQGKGFAVVAQEVRSLAEQSKQATAQVRSILGDIQKATSAAVMATEQGSKAVEAGVKQSADTGGSIQALAESIAEAAQASTQIAASSQQQMVGMDQVALAMENIKQASTQNVASTRQAEAAAQNLHELGQKLKHLVEQYQV